MRHDVEFERSRIHRIMDELSLPEGQFVLSGSAVLILHGIQRSRPMGDLDVFLATRPWMEMAIGTLTGGWRIWTTDPTDPVRRCDPPYLVKEVCGLEVNIFHAWRRRGIGDLDPNVMIRNAELVRGLPCNPLEFMLDWKLEVGRDKDLEDIRLLRDHLAA
jgi:hypothetical protein